MAGIAHEAESDRCERDGDWGMQAETVTRLQAHLTRSDTAKAPLWICIKQGSSFLAA